MFSVIIYHSCSRDASLSKTQHARVAQLVERDLAKVEAAGSSPVSRSFFLNPGDGVSGSFLAKGDVSALAPAR